MCTLTFLPGSDADFSLVSNRDESPKRETLLPAGYDLDGVHCIFPKDALAGGTWIGISALGRAVCLMNGGFKRHKMGAYGRSRGLIVLDLLTTNNTPAMLESLKLEGVEPFTVITIDWQDELKLTECVWDGNAKHIRPLESKPAIWSSRQLYTPEVAAKREAWFADFMAGDSQDLTAQLHFHRTAGIGDKENDLVMNRGFVRTKSMSSIYKNGSKVQFRYEELPQGAITHHYL